MSGRTVAAVVAGLVAATLVLSGCTRATFSPASRSTASPSAGAGGLAGGAKDGVGNDGIGDPYLPKAGNGGYDVASYDLNLRYQPSDDTLTGVATITATATADLTQFNLDLKDLTVSSATVDGAPARTRPSDDELVVTPAAGIRSGARFVVEISYGGVPAPYQVPALGEIGFLHTSDGAIAIGEPEVAASWYPVNDHPRDKATYTIAIAAPTNVVALSNGVLRQKTSAGGFTTWTWVESKPMASYLAMIVIGRFRLTQGTHDGKPVVTAVHTSLPARIDQEMARTPEVVDFLESKFGPYPFDAIGGIVVNDDRIQFALENQTRPIYSTAFFGGGRDASWVIVHEIAHQWFGDSVSIESWNEIWLNEGFATYAEWLWEEAEGRGTAQATFDRLYAAANSPIWRVPPGDPGVDELFSDSVYTRGGMTLHALRMTVGDRMFFEIVKAWAAEQAHGNATTPEFIALAERISGRQLDQLFTDWLYETKRPPRPGR